jgi:hypothetical protein
VSSGRSNGQQSPYAVAITRKTGSGCWPGEIPVETRPSLRPGFWRPSPLPCTFCFLSDRSDATSGNAIPSRPLPGLHGPSRWTGLICSKRAAVFVPTTLQAGIPGLLCPPRARRGFAFRGPIGVSSGVPALPTLICPRCCPRRGFRYAAFSNDPAARRTAIQAARPDLGNRRSLHILNDGGAVPAAIQLSIERVVVLSARATSTLVSSSSTI